MDAQENVQRLQRFRFTSLNEKEVKKPVTAASSAKQVEPLPPPGPLPLPLQLPAFTEKDIQAARNEAQATGYREGYAAAQAKFDKEKAAREDAMHALLGMIANRITLAAEAYEKNVTVRETLMNRLVMAAARKVAGDALKKEPYAAVESLLQECMTLIAGKPQVTVVASSALAPGLRQRIDTITPSLHNFTGTITVEEDASLLDQDCRVEWGNGYSERNSEDLWGAIEAVITKMNVNT